MGERYMAHCLASNASLYAYTNRGTLPLHGNAIHLLWISMDAEAECGLSVVRIPENCGLIGVRDIHHTEGSSGGFRQGAEHV
jgi:hypothetical protein